MPRLSVRIQTVTVDGFALLLAWWMRAFTIDGALAFCGVLFLILFALAIF